MIVTHDFNRRLEGQSPDTEWAAFLRALNECNAQHGVFFSQLVYETFGTYRACLVELHRKGASGTALRTDDLGSYISPHLRVGARVADV